MVMLKKLKSALAGIVAGSMLATTFSLFPVNNADPDLEANAASVCTINTNKLYQSIDGFGGINHPEWYGDLTDADRKLAFGNGEGQLGCSILRIFVNPDKNQWNKALPTAQYASKNGITVFASPWEPPSNLAENGSAYGGKLHLPKKNYGAYAQHLNDFGTYMKNNGVDL
ncbi:MAG: glucuronoarabinoxylan endo-1,4-beta-xylanase, partial [Ruminococcus sp.]|nr:glucuronoarabinoxylan endo-1,4-beta-xylanase [Ruminococcus sp.]